MIEAGRNGIQVVIEQVRVHVERHGRGGVAEHLLHRFHICAGGDGAAADDQPAVSARLVGKTAVMRVLHIISSPRGERSASITVANAFLEELLDRNPEVVVDTLDVWTEALPEFDERASSAKYKAARCGDLDEEERAVWAKIQQLADRFHQADRIVVGVPMWNWAYPYKLKQLIDLVTHRGMLFEVTGDAIGPSLDVPLAIAFLVRGQAYQEWGGRPPTEFDHQSSYIEFWLRLIGVREVRTLIVEHTWDGLAEPAIEWGRAQARAMAAQF